LQTVAVRTKSNTARRMQNGRGTGAGTRRKDIDGDRDVRRQRPAAAGERFARSILCGVLLVFR
jgi:hypothetical protein